MEAPDKKAVRIFLNPYCKYGAGRSRWEKVKAQLIKRIGVFEVEEIDSSERVIHQVSKALRNGERKFIAAGGDGTVNLLLNAIMKLRCNAGVTMGAVGLGSSNDVHKPLRKEALISGIPLRIDFENAFPCDVIRMDYQDSEEGAGTRFCLLNASIGVTAEANAIYNSRPGFIRMFQRASVTAAVIAASLQAIFTYRNISCQLTMNNKDVRRFSVTNLGIIKHPHFAGSLCYDVPLRPDDGKLGIFLCEGMSFLERVKMLLALSNGRFQGCPKTKSWTSSRLSIKSDRVFAVETDGEVIRTKSAEFSVVPKAVRFCR